MNQDPEITPIRIRPSELAGALIPVLFMVWALYVAAELVWASFQLILLLGAAGLVALLVSRVADFIGRKTGLPKKVGSVLVLLSVSGLLLFVLYLAGSQIAAQFGQLISDLPTTVARAQKTLEQYELGKSLSQFLQASTEQFKPEMVFGNVRGIFSSAAGFFTALVFFLAVALYLSLDPETYRKGFLTLLKKPHRQKRADEILSAASDQLWHFLLGQMGTMSVIAVLTTVGLWALGIPSFLALGLIAGVLAFIPVVGPALSFIPALLVSSSEGSSTIAWVMLLYGGVQFLEGNFLTPMIQSRMTSIPPVLLMTAQAVMALLFGLFGVAMAAPLAVLTVVLVDELYLKDVGAPPRDRTVAVIDESNSPEG